MPDSIGPAKAPATPDLNRWNGAERVHPALRRKVLAVISEMADAGDGTKARMMVVEGYREQARQDELYAQGRTAPGSVVTGVRRSVHTLGLACDLYFVSAHNQPTWDEPYHGANAEYGRRATARGLNWGGSWSGFVDEPHVQLISVSAQSRAWLIYRELGGAVEHLPVLWDRLKAEGLLPLDA